MQIRPGRREGQALRGASIREEPLVLGHGRDWLGSWEEGHSGRERAHNALNNFMISCWAIFTAVLSNTHHTACRPHNFKSQRGVGHSPILTSALSPVPIFEKGSKVQLCDPVTRVAKLKTRSLENNFINLS